MSTTESRAAANLAVVGGIYEAFGRGDIDFILDQIAEDCAWESWLDNHGQQAGIPPMKPRQGRAGVAEFFAYVGTSADPGVVRCRADGGSVTDEELHLYSLNDAGKVNRMRHYVDTAKQVKAYGLG